MYNYIKGIFTYSEDNIAVIEANGVGYELYVSDKTLEKLGGMGNECKVYCHLSVREDEMSLYGFADKQEKEFFKKLINISGIGCKMAISILSSGNLSDIISAIASADVSKLSKIKGVGKKTAERIVVELQDKVASGNEINVFAPAAASFGVTENGEAVDALISLGYTRQEAIAAVARSSKQGMSTEEIVYAALKG